MQTVSQYPIHGTLASGAMAVAWGALDAGMQYASSYPGTPATDILNHVIEAGSPDFKGVWSINEKVAYESAFAVAVSGLRSLVAMKHVGLNVAADAFVSSCYSGVNGGLVLVVADDPGCQSSQNEQDTRYYQRLAGNILLEPADAQEAYDMTYEAFEVSERFGLPVILRLNTNTALGYSRVTRKVCTRPGNKLDWVKNPDRYLLVPGVSRRRRALLAQLQVDLESFIGSYRFTMRKDADTSGYERSGIICTGIGYSLYRELERPGLGFLKIAGEPISKQVIEEFLKNHTRVLILEDGDTFIEDRAIQLAGTCRIDGRKNGTLPRTGELSLEHIKSWISGWPVEVIPEPPIELPKRLPEICRPCGYNKVFGALAEMPKLITPSDIGCNTLGGLAPYRVMDTNLAMGASIGMACGLASMGLKRIVAIIGDSTFYHAGIPPLINAVHQNLSFVVLLLDNGAAAMTGGQGVPHRPSSRNQNPIDLVELVRSTGVNACVVFDPHELGKEGIRKLLEENINKPGINVLLYRSQCGLYTPGYFTQAPFVLRPKEGGGESE